MGDYASLQKLALSDKGQDEAVTVNQRALIDKILARYASDNTTLRELLQNADDANATLVKIHYQSLLPTSPPLDALSSTPVRRLLVSNNGVPFRGEDWARLKRIAEGNPDAEKIGAFGVGFYSVFSVCDDPFVSSGGECMAFYWNDRDQLFVRRRDLEKPEDMTTFMLNMRSPTEVPNLPELCRFLATSLTFTRSLSTIELHFDEYKLLTLHRQAAPDSNIPLHTQSLNLTSPKKSMHLTSATLQPIQIKATYLAATQYSPHQPPTSSLKKLFSRFQPPPPPQDLSRSIDALAFLRIATAQLSVTIGPKFAVEFQRAQKKAPPKQTKVSLLCISKAEFDASTHNDPVFADLIPRGQGRVYIGFPTHQTTGFGGHVGAPALVPTVERESIDLADAQLRVWNGELLGCVGIFARVLYDLEMENLARKVVPGKIDSDLIAEAVHVMNLFTFHATTPSNRVRPFIEETFFSASKNGTIPLLTNRGVKPSNVVRLATREMPFLVNTPLLSDTVFLGAKEFIDRLREGDILRPAGWQDVKAELNGRTLSEQHAIQFMKWLLQEKLSYDQTRELLSLALVIVGDEKVGKIVNLGQISSFIVPGRIPVDGGLPPYVLPLELGKTFSAKDLESLYLPPNQYMANRSHWQELTTHEWIKFISTNPSSDPSFDIQKSIPFATTVLTAASRNWDSIPAEDRNDILALLSTKKCMPTVKKGLMLPAETYFHNVKVLPDLPLVESMKGVKERFLEQLGVRRVVALGLIFERLGEGGKWSHIDGIKYLASVQNNLTGEEMKKLREYPLCPSRTDTKRMIVSQLYEPNRDLEKLELPIISWPIDSWRNFSPEARFLYALGLNRFPSAQTLIQIASNPKNTTDLRNRSLDFFTTYYHTYEYNRTDMSKITVAFLPSEPVNGKVYLCNPSDIYSNPTCQVLGFYILDKRLIPDAAKFGVKTDPTPTAVERALTKTPPASIPEAKDKFAYAAQRITSFTKSQLVSLSRARIVPVIKNGSTTHVSPSLCFLDTHEEKESVWEEIFDFVDFGEKANIFLEALGVKDKPDASQIADQLAREPKRIYQAMDIQGYLRLLGQLGSNVGTLQRDKQLWTRLKQAAFLLGLETSMAEDSSRKTIATLARAEDIVIVDEPRLGVIFREKLIVAPERDDCETLYIALGAPNLSALVRQQSTRGGNPTTNTATETLRKHILERAGIFLALPEIAAHVRKSSANLAENLKIYAYESLIVERVLVFGRIRARDTERVTAIVDNAAKGCLLLVTDPTKVNFNQVAEALNSVLLTKSNRGTDLMFETILKENLEFLRFRGFAVDRLLNRHLEEQRLAKAKKEAEEQQRRKEEKARLDKIKAEESLAREMGMNSALGLPTGGGREMNGGIEGNGHIDPQKWKEGQKGKIPGSWQDDPTDVNNGRPPPYTSPPQPEQSLTSRTPSQTTTNQPNTSLLPDRHPLRFMNSIKNVLGLPNPSIPDRPLQQQPQLTPHPQPQNTPHFPASQSSINNQLQQAIRAVRPFKENSLFSPATSSLINEAPQSYCDSTAEQDLISYSSSPPWGLETFYVPHAKVSFDAMLAERELDMHLFAGLLQRLATVYNVRVDCFHLFFDPGKKTIAFNRSGSLFFNIAYYLELHAKDGEYSKDAPGYWFTTIAHELAHNMVHQHGAEHSYWTESFISSYILVFYQHLGSF